MELIDLRSDTVTKPTPEMRAAMAAAEVGDDVYGEDPTVNELEAVAAHMTGKAAALFVSSGTMGNVAAMMAHTQRGAEVICGYQSHVFRNEQGQLAQLCGVQAHPLLEAANGTLPLDLVAGAIQGDDQHHPITSVLALENTHNMCGGVPLAVEYMRAAGSLARAHGLKLHVDGARLFNAAVALNVSAAELVADADSVTFCLSKGLAAPAGSVLCGDVEFIKRARRARKVLGGGMRQSGILAAAGLVALRSMVERLADDHAHAQQLAHGLAAIAGVKLDPRAVGTNMVYFDLDAHVAQTDAQIMARLREQGVLIDFLYAPFSRGFRAVTHCWITAPMVERTLAAMRHVLAT